MAEDIFVLIFDEALFFGPSWLGVPGGQSKVVFKGG